MFKRIAQSVVLGMLVLGAAACADEQKPDEGPAPAAKAAEPEGPFYELTKDDVSSHADWTSRNITFKDVKLGSKGKDVESKLGKSIGVEPVGDHYRTVYEKSAYALYSHKMTGEIQKIEVFSGSSDMIADAKLKKLLSSGSADDMHAALGMEEAMEINPNTTATEYIYDAKGVRFAKYDLKGTKLNSLIFSKLKAAK